MTLVTPDTVTLQPPSTQPGSNRVDPFTAVPNVEAVKQALVVSCWFYTGGCFIYSQPIVILL